MIRIAALTAGKHDWGHGVNFSQTVNGCTRERAEAAATTTARRHVIQTLAMASRRGKMSLS